MRAGQLCPSRASLTLGRQIALSQPLGQRQTDPGDPRVMTAPPPFPGIRFLPRTSARRPKAASVTFVNFS